MHVLVIGDRESSEDSERYFNEYVSFLRQAVATTPQQADIAFTLFDNLYITVGDDVFEIYDTRTRRSVSEYAVVVLRGSSFRQYYDVIKTISTYVKQHGNLSVNDYSAFRESSKLTQALQFYTNGMPVAQTVYVTQAILQARHPLPFTFPCILKATYGSHGNDNYLVQSLEEAADIVRRTPGKKFVLQRFVPNDRDYRVLVVGDEALVIERSAAGDSHLNNTSQGGQAVLVPTENLPAAIVEQSKNIARELQLSIAGVDVLADKDIGTYHFLEVNAQPQLMTGAFTDKKAELIGRFLERLARDERPVRQDI